MDTAIDTPTSRPASMTDAPRPRRSRAKRLTAVNRGSRLGKRIAELTALFTAAFRADELTAIKCEKIADAAQLKAMAEKARGEWMRAGAHSLDDIVRLERKASAAERALGIVERAPRIKTHGLRDYLANKAKEAT